MLGKILVFDQNPLPNLDSKLLAKQKNGVKSALMTRHMNIEG